MTDYWDTLYCYVRRLVSHRTARRSAVREAQRTRGTADRKRNRTFPVSAYLRRGAVIPGGLRGRGSGGGNYKSAHAQEPESASDATTPVTYRSLPAGRTVTTQIWRKVTYSRQREPWWWWRHTRRRLTARQLLRDTSISTSTRGSSPDLVDIIRDCSKNIISSFSSSSSSNSSSTSSGGYINHRRNTPSTLLHIITVTIYEASFLKKG